MRVYLKQRAIVSSHLTQSRSDGGSQHRRAKTRKTLDSHQIFSQTLGFNNQRSCNMPMVVCCPGVERTYQYFHIFSRDMARMDLLQHFYKNSRSDMLGEAISLWQNLNGQLWML